MAARTGPNGRCAVCAHSERQRIERALAAGAGLRATARKFGFSYDSAWRHWRGHVSDEVKAQYIAGAGITRARLEELVADESLSILDHCRVIRQRLYIGLDAATECNDRVTLALLAGRLHENLSLMARLTGELQRGPLFVQNNNLMVNGDYSRAIATLVAAVAPFDGARAAVVAALRELDAASAAPQPLMIEAAA